MYEYTTARLYLSSQFPNFLFLQQLAGQECGRMLSGNLGGARMYGIVPLLHPNRHSYNKAQIFLSQHFWAKKDFGFNSSFRLLNPKSESNRSLQGVGNGQDHSLPPENHPRGVLLLNKNSSQVVVYDSTRITDVNSVVAVHIRRQQRGFSHNLVSA